MLALSVGLALVFFPHSYMNKYIATIAHDKGIYRLTVTAKSKERAVFMIMQAELCPSHAILQIKKTRV